MITTIIRYFTVDRGLNPHSGSTSLERLQFVQMCSNGAALECTDPRLVMLDEFMSLGAVWLLSSISNAAYEVPLLPYTYADVLTVDPDIGAVITVQTPVAPILSPAYYASPYWQPYAISLKSGYVQVTELEYLEAQLAA